LKTRSTLDEAALPHILNEQNRPMKETLQEINALRESGVIGWPVQFLPAESPLLKEAVEQAVTVDFEGVPTRVMTAEHLAAIALQTGWAKDFTRLLAFVESGTLAADNLTEILVSHQ
jgi:hypothetical protein